MDMVAGSDDFSIRVYKGEELIFDINENAKVTALNRIKTNLFGFALANGTFGVYYTRKLLWKQKRQSRVTAIAGMEFDMDGENELVVGFEDGTIEVRKHRSGSLVHSVTLGSAIARLVYFDFRQSGAKQLIAVSKNGQVQGYTPSVDQVKQFKEVVQTKQQIMAEEIVDLNKKKIGI
jgi:Bardet-Biedl syndrome 2 protein